MHRRPARAVLTCATLVLLLAGCGTDGRNASDSKTPPATGACYRLAVDDLGASSNHGDDVACTEPHTAQTFAVGTLPDAGYDDPALGTFVYDTCQQAFGPYLGADDSAVLRSRLSWSWFRPSEKGWKDGARWYRCDVVGGPDGATALRDLPTDAKDLFARDYPDAWMTCARGDDAQTGNKVACDEAHDWRAVTTIKVAEADAPYPGDRIAEVRSRDYCRDSVRAWLGYPPDFDFAYTWFRADRWAGGNHRAICWARTTK